MEKHERLKLMRINAGYRHGTSAATAMQAVVSTYLGHENGSRTFGDSDARKYAEFFEADLAWLLTGKGNPPTNPDQPAAYTSRSAEVAGIPILGQISSKSWSEDTFEQLASRPVGPKNRLSLIAAEHDSFALLIQEKELGPHVPFGAYAVVVKPEIIQDGDFLVVERSGFNGELRQIVAGKCATSKGNITVHLGKSNYVLDSAEITLVGRITHVVTVL